MPSAAPPMASFWLLAAPEDEAMLTAEIDRLAGRHATPQFHPHLTILGDIARDPATLIEQTRQIAAAANAFAAPIAGILGSDAYFRSFYAAFAENAPLRALRNAVEAAFGLPPGDFMPHVSLLYGPIDQAAKARSISEVAQHWNGRPIRFNRIALTNSSNDTPIAQWRCLHIEPLRPAGQS